MTRSGLAEPRFIVDDRCGCVAVRDTTKIDGRCPGLHGDEDDCVRFWMKGKVEVKCECCGHVRIQFDSESHVAEAHAMAEKLNKQEATS